MSSTANPTAVTLDQLVKTIIEFACIRGIQSIDPRIAAMTMTELVQYYQKLVDGEGGFELPFNPKPKKRRKFENSVPETLELFSGNTPILFVGPPGVGKTFACREYAEAHGFAFFRIIAGHSGLESFDILGQTQMIDGATTWMDGEVSEVFRAVGCDNPADLPAVKGSKEKGLLLFDEIYRIPNREREFLLSMLSPHEVNGVRCYQLTTNRPIKTPGKAGSYHKETLYAPVENLAIVATTNLGIDFEVDEGCPASRERWVVHHVEPSDAVFHDLIVEALESRGFAPELGKYFMELKAGLDSAKKDLHLRETISVRTALRIIEISPNESAFARVIFQVGQIWLSHDSGGTPLKEQVSVLVKAIKNAGF